MPTSEREAVKIKEIIDGYLSHGDARSITARLYDEVGQLSDNDSLKTSLLMLKNLYEGEKNG